MLRFRDSIGENRRSRPSCQDSEAAISIGVAIMLARALLVRDKPAQQAGDGPAETTP